MKAIKYTAFIILAAALLFALAETAYFGWNLTPASRAEERCDEVVYAGLYASLILGKVYWWLKVKTLRRQPLYPQ